MTAQQSPASSRSAFSDIHRGQESDVTTPQSSIYKRSKMAAPNMTQDTLGTRQTSETSMPVNTLPHHDDAIDQDVEAAPSDADETEPLTKADKKKKAKEEKEAAKKAKTDEKAERQTSKPILKKQPSILQKGVEKLPDIPVIGHTCVMGAGLIYFFYCPWNMIMIVWWVCLYNYKMLYPETGMEFPYPPDAAGAPDPANPVNALAPAQAEFINQWWEKQIYSQPAIWQQWLPFFVMGLRWQASVIALAYFHIYGRWSQLAFYVPLTYIFLTSLAIFMQWFLELASMNQYGYAMWLFYPGTAYWPFQGFCGPRVILTEWWGVILHLFIDTFVAFGCLFVVAQEMPPWTQWTTSLNPHHVERVKAAQTAEFQRRATIAMSQQASRQGTVQMPQTDAQLQEAEEALRRDGVLENGEE